MNVFYIIARNKYVPVNIEIIEVASGEVVRTYTDYEYAARVCANLNDMENS